jgi:hypothetical protein
MKEAFFLHFDHFHSGFAILRKVDTLNGIPQDVRQTLSPMLPFHLSYHQELDTGP